MEFRDLKTQYQRNKKQIDEAINEVLQNTNFISGKQVEELEQELADYAGTRHCISCANGTDALQLALMTWKIGKEDAVFVPDFTFFSSAEVIALQGATPVFVDIDENTFNIAPESLEEAVRRVQNEGILRPKAVIAVDLFGQPADYDRIRPIADKYGLKLLEDGAQGFGGMIRKQRACSFGDISTTSFFPAKPLGCYGDGGAIFTDNDEWAALLRSYRVHGKGTDKYDNMRIGINSRLDTLQAAILKVKLNIFKAYELEDINKAARQYSEKLAGSVKVPTLLPDFYSSWAQYSIICKNTQERGAIQRALKEQGIPSMIYYRKPMHLQGAFLNQTYTCPVDLTNATDACKRVLSLPLHPYMEMQDIDVIVQVINSLTQGNGGDK